MNDCRISGDMEDINKSSCDLSKLTVDSGRGNSYRNQMGRFGAEKVIISDNQPRSLRELSESEIC